MGYQIGSYFLIRHSAPTYDFKLRSACPSSNRRASFERRISYLSRFEPRSEVSFPTPASQKVSVIGDKPTAQPQPQRV